MYYTDIVSFRIRTIHIPFTHSLQHLKNDETYELVI